MGDRFLSSVFFSCFWILLLDSTVLMVIEYFPYLLALRLPCVELEVSQLFWFEEKISHVLETDGDKLFKDLLTNKIFSEQILC